MLVALKLHYFLAESWIPNENFEVKSDTNKDLIFLTVRDFPDSPSVTFQFFAWQLRIIVKQLIVYFEMRLKETFDFLIFCIINLFWDSQSRLLIKVPQPDHFVVTS
jgi:hypothetical protein